MISGSLWCSLWFRRHRRVDFVDKGLTQYQTRLVENHPTKKDLGLLHHEKAQQLIQRM
jgi:hypothetical protein